MSSSQKKIALSCLTAVALLHGVCCGVCPLLAAPGPAIRGRTDQASQTHRQTAVSLFSDRMNKHYRIVVEKYAGADLQDTISELTTSNLVKVDYHQFKSKEPIQPESRVFIQLHLRTYVYDRDDNAEAAFAAYTGKQQKIPEEMRSKSPLLALKTDDRIFILHGSCLLSAVRWSAVEQQLRLAVEQTGRQITADLRKSCGGKLDKR